MRDNWTLYKIQRVEKILGYELSDRGLLLEAICHGASQSLSLTFQRLESLGDAVPEYVATKHYLKKYPEMPMEDLRAYKSLVLYNNTLGCMFSALGLESYFDSGNRLPDHAWKQDTQKRLNHIYSRGNWIHLRPNKKLADGVEAIMGAVFIDSKFLVGPVEDLLCQTLYPFVDNSKLDSKIEARKMLLSTVLDNN